MLSSPTGPCTVRLVACVVRDSAVWCGEQVYELLNPSAWRAGQYLRNRPDEELIPQLAAHWAECGLLKSAEQTPFVVAAVAAAKKSLVRP